MLRITVRLSPLAACIALLCSPLLAQTQGSSEYDALLKRVQQGDATVDYRAFRTAGARLANGKASIAETSARQEFKQLMSSGNYPAALESANRDLARNYAGVVAHFDAMIANQALQKTEEAALHEKILDALLDSIQSSGDGKSMQTAWFVVTTQEEYILIRRRLNLVPKGQGLVREKGHAYDRLDVIDPKTNQPSAIWFNVDFDMGLYK